MNFKKGFTLIELLVVVAILGILSTIGVVAYNNYTTSAKITVTKNNLYSLLQFYEEQLALCKLSQNIELMSDENNQKINKIPCSTGSGYLSHYVVNHLNNSGYKNPFNQDQPAFVTKGRPYSKGQTYNGVGGNSNTNPNANWWFRTKINDDNNQMIQSSFFRNEIKYEIRD